MKKLINLFIIASGIFTFCVAQAYTLQDYYQANDDVVNARTAYDNAAAEAQPNYFDSQIDDIYLEWRRASDLCIRTEGGASIVNECLASVEQEYYAKRADIEMAINNAQMNEQQAYSDLISAEDRLAMIRQDLVSQGLM